MTPCNEHSWQEIFSGKSRGSSAITTVYWCSRCGSARTHTSYIEIMRHSIGTFTPTYQPE